MNIKKILFALIIALAILYSFSIVSAGWFDSDSNDEPTTIYLNGNITSVSEDYLLEGTASGGNLNMSKVKGNITANINISSLTEDQKEALNKTFEERKQPDAMFANLKEGENETIQGSLKLISYSIDNDTLTLNLTVEGNLDATQQHTLSKIALSDISFNFNSTDKIYDFTAKR